jgi:lysophospholipase L1-like esterase
VLPAADHLDATIRHQFELIFRAADLGQRRWRASTAHLRLAGLVLDRGGAVMDCARCRKRAIAFGDSITEGVGVDGLFTSWQLLGVSNARATWLPIVCRALGCEYGQLGSGGQGMLNVKMELPPLPQTWDHYDPATSRLTNGRLLPEPDYVFCAMGTNDFGPEFGRSQPFIEAYAGWLAAVRAACPHARIFCITPPLGTHADDVRAAVAVRNRAGDARAYLIDTSPLQEAFNAKGATRLAYDGVHPSVYGNALLSALIAVETQKVLSRGE